jgi:hypothetical protein
VVKEIVPIKLKGIMKVNVVLYIVPAELGISCKLADVRPYSPGFYKKPERVHSEGYVFENAELFS